MSCPRCTINIVGICEPCPHGWDSPECRGCLTQPEPSLLRRHAGKLTLLALIIGVGVWARMQDEPQTRPA